MPDKRVVSDLMRDVEEILLELVHEVEGPNKHVLRMDEMDKQFEKLIYAIAIRDRNFEHFFRDVKGEQTVLQFKPELDEVYKNYKDSLKTATNIIGTWDLFNNEPYGHMIRFSQEKFIANEIAFVNVSPEHIDKTIQLLGNHLQGIAQHGSLPVELYIPDFRVVKPRHLIRADNIIIKFNVKLMRVALSEWAKEIHSFVHERPPLLTKRVLKGVGVMGAPREKHQVYYIKHMGRPAHTGLHFFSLVLARAFYKHYKQLGKVPHDIRNLAEAITHYIVPRYPI